MSSGRRGGGAELLVWKCRPCGKATYSSRKLARRAEAVAVLRGEYPESCR